MSADEARKLHPENLTNSLGADSNQTNDQTPQKVRNDQQEVEQSEAAQESEMDVNCKVFVPEIKSDKLKTSASSSKQQDDFGSSAEKVVE